MEVDIARGGFDVFLLICFLLIAWGFFK